MVLAAVLAGIGGFVVTKFVGQREKRAGDVYDFRKDQKLIQTVRTTLSLEAVMTRLTTSNQDGTKPEVRYDIDAVSKLKSGQVEVRYRLYIQSPLETKQLSKRKVFYRKKDGTWAALREN